MKKLLNKNNLIFILILMTLFSLMMPNISYAANISINDVLKDTVAAWFIVLRSIAMVVMIILLLVLAIKAVVSKSSSEKSLFKAMLMDWIVGIVLILGIQYFIIGCIEINESMIIGSEKLGQKLSGMQEGQEISLYESTRLKAYEIKFKSGTIGMILYVMFVYYAYKFVLVYLKRYINVLVLILLAPIVCLFHAFKKVVTGKAFRLKQWFKEFIYNVFLQSFHAVMYASVVGLALRFSDTNGSFIGAFLCTILFGVVFKLDKLIRKFFNHVGGDTSIKVSAIDNAISRPLKNTGKHIGSNLKNGILGDKSKFSELKWSKISGAFKNGLRESVNEGKVALKDFYKENVDGLKNTFEDFSGTMFGENKYVSQAEIDKEQEKMNNAGFIGRSWTNIVTGVKNLPKNIEKLRKYLEEKKKKAVTYIQDLKRDVETIKAIPVIVKNFKDEYANLKDIVDKYKQNDLSIFTENIDPPKFEQRLSTIINLSSSDITPAVILATGYLTFVKKPKIGLMMLAQNNYMNMIHPEIPMEARRIISGINYKYNRLKFKFKRFENGSIKSMLKVFISDVKRSFSNINVLSRVKSYIDKKTLGVRTFFGNTKKKFKAKKNSIINRYIKMKLIVQRYRAVLNDFNIARNVNTINNLNALESKSKYPNLSPEVLKMLKNCGVVVEVKVNKNFEGGYIFLNNAIRNAVMRTRVGQYVTQNSENALAGRINQFLDNNTDSMLAIRISNYVINNQESALSSLIDRMQITEDGRILTNIESFKMTNKGFDISQLGTVTKQGIVQTIITADGLQVEQIVDKQGKIIREATDKDGNKIEFPVENGRRMQTVVSPDGSIMLQVMAEDGTTIMPVVLNEASFEKTVQEEQVEVEKNKSNSEVAEREELRGKITEYCDAMVVDLSTKKTESIGDLRLETEILTALVSETIDKPVETTVEERIDNMDALFEQIGILQSEGLTEELLSELETEKELAYSMMGVSNERALKKLATSEVPENDSILQQIVLASSDSSNLDNEEPQDNLAEMIEILTAPPSESTSSSVYDVSEISVGDIYEQIIEDNSTSTINSENVESRFDEVLETITAGTVTDTSVEDLYKIINNSASTEERTKANIVESRKKAPQKAKQTGVSEDDKIKLMLEIIGAVINPRKIEDVILKTSTVDDIVRKYCGGLTENVNREKYDKIAKKLVSAYNGKKIKIDELTKKEVEAKKEKQKQNKVEHKISIYLYGNGSEVYGEKIIAEQSSIGDIRTLFRRDANIKELRVNNQRASLSTILSDGDEVYVPLLTINEKDLERNIPKGLIDNFIKDFVEDYIKSESRSPQYRGKTELEILQIISENRVLKRRALSEPIAEKLKEKCKVEIPEEEVKERLDEFLRVKIKQLEKVTPLNKESVKSKRRVTSEDESSGVFVTVADPRAMIELMLKEVKYVGADSVTVSAQQELIQTSAGFKMRETGDSSRDALIGEMDKYLTHRREKLILE